MPWDRFVELAKDLQWRRSPVERFRLVSCDPVNVKIARESRMAPRELNPPEGSISREERIRRRAYELYVARGREAGREIEDWLRAEQELLKQEEEAVRLWKLNH
jgi:hypothetical protein